MQAMISGDDLAYTLAQEYATCVAYAQEAGATEDEMRALAGTCGALERVALMYGIDDLHHQAGEILEGWHHEQALAQR